ncbi:MAG: hypothetical protein M3Y86_04560 [Verrucomicrobiota bacterium]|nr:hypothetical protein [Verrucomicrobiota bacterium]
MKRLLGCAFLFFAIAAPELRAQGLSASKLASPAGTPRPGSNATAPKPRAAASAAPKKKEEKEEKDPVKSMVGGNSLPKGEPITTEIFADEAFFDSPKHTGVFTGHVIVNDPRFNVQSDKLTIYMTEAAKPDPDAPPTPTPAPGEPTPSPTPAQTLDKAVAEGNVGVVRDRPGENGEPPTRSVGRSDMAIYTTSDGRVELRGTPRVQSGMNTHVATSPDTIMIIEQNGQLTTKGPSRTEIKQEPKAPSPTPTPAAPALTPAAKATPTAKTKP